MVKHIVFWTLEDGVGDRSAADSAAEIKVRLEALAGTIPGLLHIEVGIDIGRTGASADLALYSEFTDRAALDAYQAHPGHLAVAEFVNTVRRTRAVVDYEV